jgi:glutamine synthetase
VAPAQYEIAPIFTTANVATDHNQITMETLQKVARRHGFVCLMHEKPFAGVNGSGKHNNWSLVTDTGTNLLDPGTTPHENMVFLVFLCAVIRAVDKYGPLLRASVANPGNEHRLGANEAPPAIVSIFLGDQLTDIVEQLAAGGAKTSKQGGSLKLGTSLLPPLPKDCTDRNRTSPFAFTGNKFEFRMVGSSQSTAGPCFTLNTMVADVLMEIADVLEKSQDVRADVQKLLKQFATDHARIIFNGDNYGPEWVLEAQRRGLPNLRSTVESLAPMLDKEHVALFERQGVLSRHELQARTEILYENYSKTLNIEAGVTLEIAKRQILPRCMRYATRLARSIKELTAAEADAPVQKRELHKVSRLIEELSGAIDALEKAVGKARASDTTLSKAESFRDEVFPAMGAVRKIADTLETLVDADLWPLPSYAQMLFTR